MSRMTTSDLADRRANPSLTLRDPDLDQVRKAVKDIRYGEVRLIFGRFDSSFADISH